jgi:hypothetical protein
MGALLLRIRGQVSSAVCRTTPKGQPVLVVLLTDASGQEVRATHAYADASPSSHYAAAALARSLRGQEAELDAINPRFKQRRLDCDASHIYPDQSSTYNRKDLA